MWGPFRSTIGNMCLAVSGHVLILAKHDSGLDVSPAVRDYLGLSGSDVCDWKFVDVYEVPDGPWTLYGDNNTAAKLRSRLKGALKKAAATDNEKRIHRSRSREIRVDALRVDQFVFGKGEIRP